MRKVSAYLTVRACEARHRPFARGIRGDLVLQARRTGRERRGAPRARAIRHRRGQDILRKGAAAAGAAFRDRTLLDQRLQAGRARGSALARRELALLQLLRRSAQELRLHRAARPDRRAAKPPGVHQDGGQRRAHAARHRGGAAAGPLGDVRVVAAALRPVQQERPGQDLDRDELARGSGAESPCHERRRRRIAPRMRRLPKSLRTGRRRRVRPVAQRSAPTRSRSCSTSSSRSARISSSIWSP